MKNKEKQIHKKKRALITGITGQDGSYLAEYLLKHGYEVWGLVRRTSLNPHMRIEHLTLPRHVKLIYGNMRDEATLREAIQQSHPDEIYNLAALSDVWISFKCADETMDINCYGLGRLVYQAMKLNPKVRIYQASTSEMFGATNPPQNEKSSFKPVSPYGEAKLRAHEDYVKGYRENHGLFICSGFLFNHESPRRGEHFVTRKITLSLAKIKFGLQESFELGNLEAHRDWGFAGDYVKAMHLMLQQKEPRDYVIATGVSNSVRDFFEAACRELDMKVVWGGKRLKETATDKKRNDILTINKAFYRPKEVDALRGDATRAKKLLGWEPKTSFEELAALMAQADYEKFSKGM